MTLFYNGHGGGRVVSVLALDSDDASLNNTAVYSPKTFMYKHFVAHPIRTFVIMTSVTR